MLDALRTTAPEFIAIRHAVHAHPAEQLTAGTAFWVELTQSYLL